MMIGFRLQSKNPPKRKEKEKKIVTEAIIAKNREKTGQGCMKS